MNFVSNPELMAEHLLDTYWRGRAMPVDPVEIASRLNIECRVTTLPRDIAGVLLYEKSDVSRLVAEVKDSPLRRRFVHACLLGLLLEKNAGLPNAPDSGKQVLARDAIRCAENKAVMPYFKRFALELLMSKSVLKKVYHKRSVSLLIGDFCAPQEAINARCEFFGQ